MAPQTSRASEPTTPQIEAPRTAPVPEPASNVLHEGSGTGRLPDLEDIAWERNTRGGYEAWLAPKGRATPRKEKKYLGYIGVRKLRTLNHEQICTWINDKRIERQL